MGERYTRLFALPGDLYAEGSPVVLAAGALLKDNETGKVLAQLKIKNISGKTIKAAKVRVTPFDTVSKPLGGEANHQYLDLKIERDEAFGQKVAIELPDAATRAFAAAVTEVDFVDNSVWLPSGAAWEPLPKRTALADWLNDAELEKQYQLEYGKDCKYALLEVKDLWLCSCGEINRQEETGCHRCEKRLIDLKAVDLEKLKAEKDARLAAEKEKEEKEKATAEIRAKETKKKIKKIAAIIVPVVAVLIAAAVLISNAVTRKNAYNQAIALLESDISANENEAYQILTELGGYKDVQNMLSDFEYALLCEQGDYLTGTGRYEYVYEYDERGQLVEIVHEDGYVIHYTYDEDGRNIKQTDNKDQSMVEYWYNEKGTMFKSSYQFKAETANGSEVFILTKCYNEDGWPVEITNNYNGETFLYSYNAKDGTLVSVECINKTNSGEYTSTVDLSGHNLKPADVAWELYPRFEETSEDGTRETLYRITTELEEIIRYELDVKGNPIRGTEAAGSYTYQYSYDEEGNLIQSVVNSKKGDEKVYYFYYGYIYAPNSREKSLH